jgi:2-polyprenyl-6-methoxyphenol hydroxylase-like FAD-dependent oxidoreductase
VSRSYTFRTARGHTLAVLSSGDGGSPEEYTISCSRHQLWRCLYEIVGENNVQHGEVVDVELEPDRAVVRFADGASRIADLVIGADGVRSVVKRVIFGEEDKKCYAPVYEYVHNSLIAARHRTDSCARGICGVGAFINRDPPTSVTADQSMVFTFGPSGSFGYCSAAPQDKQLVGWWSNWRLVDIPESNLIDAEEVHKQLLDRHGSWKDPVIQEIIAAMSTDRIYPLWTTPELPYWGKDRALILGDAAHTLQANSGQGASQALEDSVAFTLLLASYLTKGKSDRDAIDLATRGLYQIRNPHVQTIKSQARNLFIMKKRVNNVIVEYALYCFIFLWTRFPVLSK